MGKYTAKSGHSAVMRYDMSEFEKWIETIENVSSHDNTKEYIHHILYPAVGCAADELRTAVQELHVDTDDEIAETMKKGKQMKRGVTETEKEALESGLGVTKHKETEDSIDAKAGFGGYCDIYPNSKYNKGKGFPIPLLANSICAGTSFREQEDFVLKAYNKFKSKYSKEAEKASEEWLKENGIN